MVLKEEVCKGSEIASSIYHELSTLIHEPIVKENRAKIVYLLC